MEGRRQSGGASGGDKGQNGEQGIGDSEQRGRQRKQEDED